MATTLFTNARLVTLDTVLSNHAILVEDGTIGAVGPSAELAGRSADSTVDAAGAYLAAGFIDLHIHGVRTHSVDAGPESLAEMCQVLPAYGVTGFLPTVCPLPKGQDATFLETLSTVKSQGTEILGFHLEGPFLCLTGALSEEALGDADIDRVKALIAACAPHGAVFSVSPEFAGLEKLLPLMTADGMPVFMTHTQARGEETLRAIAAGVTHATHFLNVFYPPESPEMGVRFCGAAEAVMATPEVTVDVIVDGEHVDPLNVQMVIQCKAPDRISLITDANVGAGLPPGRYSGCVNDDPVEFAYPGGPARLTEESRFPGGLAGSGLTMDLAVRNAVKMLGVDVPLAVRMASANPAAVLHLQDRKGRITEGYDADLVLLDDELRVLGTWVAGRRKYAADNDN